MKKLISACFSLFLIAITPDLSGRPAAGIAADTPDKISLRLKTSAHTGYAPLQVTLSGELLGADEDDLGTCQLSEEWTEDNPLGNPYPANTKKYLPCVTRLADGKVPRSFQRDVILQEPGRYSYRILLTPNGQRTMASKSIEIKVSRPRFQVKGVGVAH